MRPYGQGRDVDPVRISVIDYAARKNSRDGEVPKVPATQREVQ